LNFGPFPAGEEASSPFPADLESSDFSSDAAADAGFKALGRSQLVSLVSVL